MEVNWKTRSETTQNLQPLLNTCLGADSSLLVWDLSVPGAGNIWPKVWTQPAELWSFGGLVATGGRGVASDMGLLRDLLIVW